MLLCTGLPSRVGASASEVGAAAVDAVAGSSCSAGVSGCSRASSIVPLTLGQALDAAEGSGSDSLLRGSSVWPRLCRCCSKEEERRRRGAAERLAGRAISSGAGA